jgi:hypothetical protein
MAISQYRLTGYANLIIATAHGNSKRKRESYYRTKRSKLCDAREATTTKRQKRVIFDINNAAGEGPSSIDRDVLRSRQQVYDLKRNSEGFARFGSSTKSVNLSD